MLTGSVKEDLVFLKLAKELRARGFSMGLAKGEAGWYSPAQYVLFTRPTTPFGRGPANCIDLYCPDLDGLTIGLDDFKDHYTVIHNAKGLRDLMNHDG